MALFGTTKKKETREKNSRAVATRPEKVPSKDGREHIVLHAPWFSEKALIGTEKGIYVFEVPKTATKRDIANAVSIVYRVTPRKIGIVNLPGKKVSLKNRRGTGTRAARRKAYVYLKKGETINLA